MVELLVALLISGLLISITVGVFGLFQKSIALDQGRAGIAQNGRVAFDRISRELRQTPAVMTVFPANPADTSVTQPGEIEFEDGHDNDLSYNRYYVSGGLLKMDKNEYYFSYASGTRVRKNAAGNGGATAIKHVISTQDIADSVQSLKFYGIQPIQMVMVTVDTNGQTFSLRTKIFERNL